MTTTTTSHDNGQSTIQITRYWENNAEIAHVVTVWERGYGSLRSSLYRGALESPTRRRGHSVFNTNQTSDAAVAMHQSTCDYADMVLA